MSATITKINKLLVANRGEIAIRILRAASELRITTVAVYSFEDRYSLHRYKADESYQIGEDTEPLKPYLDIEELISLAKLKKADAIHPGYGFLSENVHFAQRCKEEGIIFVGPRPDVMQRLGNKVAAKIVADEIGIPTIPDSRLAFEQLDLALSEAEKIGYPIMLKAASGGGGRGMRVLRSADDLKKSFVDARAEAMKSFGDDTVFLEKFIETPKHIEVQLLGDQYGNLVHLFERDCSVQRRFQKVVEVAPSNLPETTRQKLFDYAIKLGNYVKYDNAGTVEFLVDKNGEIYFIEVNPRIQVEHTITEEITGIDIVRSQILIAAGVPLNHPQIFIHSQQEIQCNGFSIQCRITTEDPQNNFKPDYGQIIAYRNAAGFGVRLDEGSSYAGVKISPFFDSMLVKVSVSGRTLKGSALRMRRALTEFRIRGVKTNIQFLINVMDNVEFQEGNARVPFIGDNPDLVVPRVGSGKDRATKIIQYLAELIVNGHPDVQRIDSQKVFRNPPIPPFERGSAYPPGSRDRLKQLGKTAFLEDLKNDKRIHFTDTTLRDAHQSLFATRLRTTDMLAIAEGMAKNNPNIFSMEVWGGATFDVAMRFLHEDPWQRLRLLREAIPNILFQMLFRGSNAVGYTAYPDNVIGKFIEKAAENGMDIFRIFDSLNWVDAMKYSIKTVKERTDGIAEVCICYTGDVLDKDRPKYHIQYYLDLARRMEDEGADILCIKDMAGLLKPQGASHLISELKKVIHLPIHLHTHDTSSIQSTTYLKAIEAGVDIVDVALSSMSGLTSQPNFNALLALLQGHERENKLDLKNLNAYSNYFEVVREYYYPFESELKSGTAEVYEHEIPGGQYSNLLPQARSLGLEDKFDLIKENYKVVNRMFGDLVKVTPSSKVVGDMAMFMTSNNLSEKDIYERGESLSFPDSVKAMFRGDLGQPEGGWPSKLQTIILKGEKPYTDRPNAHLSPCDFEEVQKTFEDKHKQKFTEQDILSAVLYPRVFDDFVAFKKKFGDVSFIPTPAFYYPLKPNQEIMVEIEPGKMVLIRYMYHTEPNDEGNRDVFFKINGMTRSVSTFDKASGKTKEKNRKVGGAGDVGAPLQGRLIQLLVKEGDKIEKNQALFVIEAMKMESTITSNIGGKVQHVFLNQGAMVDQDDAVVNIG
jgi:pyruvate carboxylase